MNSIVNGQEMILTFSRSAQLLFPAFVAESPAEAVQRIFHHYKQYPHIDGSNIPGIVKIRDSLYAQEVLRDHVNCLSIIAPHTHWESNHPIIYHYNFFDKRYIIGHHPVNPIGTYYPVSFVIGMDKPIPFEWCDSSLKIDTKEYTIALGLICQLNSDMKGQGLPLGIGIDFRFKQSLFESSVSTVEFPEEDTTSELYDFSYIVSQDEFKKSHFSDQTEQVAWHSVSSKYFSLSIEEESLCAELRNFLSSYDNEEERIQVLNKLEQQLLPSK